MNAARQALVFHRIDQYELSLCLFFNSICHRRLAEIFFAGISRLGNGVFWYVLILALAVFEETDGLRNAAHLIAVGLTNTLLYKILKRRLGRQRPYISHKTIRLGTPALDWYSFPSGHTLHAVAFTIVTLAYYPALAWLLIPFTVLVAFSRIILGLHYPSDVLAGIAIGGTLAASSLSLLS